MLEFLAAYLRAVVLTHGQEAAGPMITRNGTTSSNEWRILGDAVYLEPARRREPHSRTRRPGQEALAVAVARCGDAERPLAFERPSRWASWPSRRLLDETRSQSRTSTVD